MSVIHLRPQNALAGAFFITVAVFAMSLQDALVKLSSSQLPLWQLFTLRAAMAAVPFAVIGFLGRTAVRPFTPWVMLRAFLLCGMYLSLYAVTPYLELATIAAAFYTGPLFTTLFSVLLIAEPASPRRWFANVLGLAGVMLVVRPGTAAFDWLTLVPIAGAVCYALAAVITRARCATAHPVSLALGLNVALFATGVVLAAVQFALPVSGGEHSTSFLFGPWRAIDASTWSVIAALAALFIVIGLGLAKAYQTAPPAVVATFDYAYLLFAAMWGYVFFNEIPDAASVSGIAIIIVAGLIAAMPSRRLDPALNPDG